MKENKFNQNLPFVTKKKKNINYTKLYFKLNSLFQLLIGTVIMIPMNKASDNYKKTHRNSWHLKLIISSLCTIIQYDFVMKKVYISL